MQGEVSLAMLLSAKTAYVSTELAAKALGVSVSTVKRWVDDGVLPAHKTAGGHRKLLVADVIEMARRGDLPHADLGQLLDRRERKADRSSLADDLYDALIGGHGDLARSLIHSAYRRGKSIELLADEAIAPAMQRIGMEWEAGRLDVMDEHRASQLCASALYELKAFLEGRAAKDRPRAVGGAVEGDYSSLPTLLAQMVLLDSGWDAVNLGPNTPFASFEKAIDTLRPRLLWLSVSHIPPDDEFVAGYRELYRHAERAGVAVALGGRALAESVRSRIPYTTYGDGLGHLAAFARTLHPRPAQPRRGRPRHNG